MREKLIPFLLFLALVGGVIAYARYGNKSVVGEFCEKDSECKKGLFCGKDLLSGLCTSECETPAECDKLGKGLICLGDENHCAKRCSGHGDCPRTHACVRGACRVGGKTPNN